MEQVSEINDYNNITLSFKNFQNIALVSNVSFQILNRIPALSNKWNDDQIFSNKLKINFEFNSCLAFFSIQNIFILRRSIPSSGWSQAKMMFITTYVVR